jgi:hypothetical protein
MTLLRATLLLLAAAALTGPALVHAQEPATRAETLQREREQKATTLQPPEKNRLERALLDLESGRFFERLLNPAEGLYPKIGNIATGSGFSLGPGYRHPGLFGGHVDFAGFAAASVTQYWMFDARLLMPRLAGGRAGLDVHARRYDFPEEEFFGIGPDSSREDNVFYGLKNTTLGVSGAFRPTPWLSVSAGVDHLQPAIDARTDEGSLFTRFAPSDVPGVLVQPNYFMYSTQVDVNTRLPRGNPRRGGRYILLFERYEDSDIDLFSFNRVEVDLQRYVPVLHDRRVLAVRGRVSMADADEGAEVPFYYLRTLGGADDLRGFRNLRFRDRNTLLLQAEYRWEIFTAMDAALFFDAGKVAPRREDLDFHDLETDYGIGFRFGTVNGVFLRIEGAYGSSDGPHFVMRFGHVF